MIHNSSKICCDKIGRLFLNLHSDMFGFLVYTAGFYSGAAG